MAAYAPSSSSSSFTHALRPRGASDDMFRIMRGIDSLLFNRGRTPHAAVCAAFAPLLASPWLQRLRGVSQFSTPMGHRISEANMSEHSRYTHAIGVACIALRIMRRWCAERTVSTHHARLLIIAALVHDVGHGPCSHAFDTDVIPLLFNSKSDASVPECMTTSPRDHDAVIGIVESDDDTHTVDTHTVDTHTVDTHTVDASAVNAHASMDTGVEGSTTQTTTKREGGSSLDSSALTVSLPPPPSCSSILTHEERATVILRAMHHDGVMRACGCSSDDVDIIAAAICGARTLPHSAPAWISRLMCAADTHSLDIDRADYIVRDARVLGLRCASSLARAANAWVGGVWLEPWTHELVFTRTAMWGERALLTVRTGMHCIYVEPTYTNYRRAWVQQHVANMTPSRRQTLRAFALGQFVQDVEDDACPSPPPIPPPATLARANSQHDTASGDDVCSAEQHIAFPERMAEAVERTLHDIDATFDALTFA